MDDIYKYRIYCETESAWVTTWAGEEPTICPNNVVHTISSGSIVIIEDWAAIQQLPEYRYVVDDSESQTTNTAFQEKINLLINDVPSGTYRIKWSYESVYNQANSDFIARIQVDDGTDIMYHQQEPEASVIGQSIPSSGFTCIPLSSGSHTIDLDYKAQVDHGSACIKRARLEFWRIE